MHRTFDTQDGLKVTVSDEIERLMSVAYAYSESPADLEMDSRFRKTLRSPYTVIETLAQSHTSMILANVSKGSFSARRNSIG